MERHLRCLSNDTYFWSSKIYCDALFTEDWVRVMYQILLGGLELEWHPPSLKTVCLVFVSEGGKTAWRHLTRHFFPLKTPKLHAAKGKLSKHRASVAPQQDSSCSLIFPLTCQDSGENDPKCQLVITSTTKKHLATRIKCSQQKRQDRNGWDMVRTYQRKSVINSSWFLPLPRRSYLWSGLLIMSFCLQYYRKSTGCFFMNWMKK